MGVERTVRIPMTSHYRRRRGQDRPPVYLSSAREYSDRYPAACR